MGDFDRNQAPKQDDQSKKIAFVVILGVVFICVLGYPMMKRGPQSAEGATGGGDASIAPSDSTPDETPDQARDALHNDPTASLLTGAPKDGQEFSKIPHNPFLRSTEWRSALIRPADPVHPVAVRSYDPAPVVAHVSLTVKADAYKLASIVQQQDHLLAIINGTIVTTGMFVDGARVVEIRADHVTLQNADDPEGPSVQVALVPKLK